MYHSITTDRLSTKLQEITGNRETTGNLIKLVEDTCNTYSLDIDLLSEKLLEVLNGNSRITNPNAYVRAVIHNVVNEQKDNFKKQWKKPIFNTLHRALEDNGFTGESWELVFLDLIEEHCANEMPVSAEDLIQNNRVILDYCISKNKLTYADFIGYFKKSKLVTLKCNVPYVVLEKKAKQETAEYEQIIKELEDNSYGNKNEEDRTES